MSSNALILSIESKLHTSSLEAFWGVLFKMLKKVNVVFKNYRLYGRPGMPRVPFLLGTFYFQESFDCPYKCITFSNKYVS